MGCIDTFGPFSCTPVLISVSDNDNQFVFWYFYRLICINKPVQIQRGDHCVPVLYNDGVCTTKSSWYKLSVLTFYVQLVPQN